MNIKRKIIALLTVSALCLPLCGCNINETSINDMLRPPQLSESRQQIQRTAFSLIGDDCRFVSPRGGNNRGAINLCDLDGDGQNEAICLYSAGDAPVGILILRKSGEKWAEWGRYTGDATSVDRLEIADLDSDGIKDIAVGWSYLTGGDNVLEILSLTDSVRSVHKELYSQFVIAGQKQNKIVLLHSSAASATLIGYRNGAFATLSSVPVDPNIRSFISIAVSETTAKTPAVYIDVQTEKEYHTEVLVIRQDEYLENKLFTADAAPLSRQSALRCTDIDGDGVLEIPCDHPQKQGEPLTDWCTFDSQTLSAPLVTFTSSAEQFYFIYPAAWLDKVFVTRDAKQDRTYRFTDKAGTLLYSLRVFTVSEYTTVPAGDWVTVIESADKVIAYQPTAPKEFPFTTEQWAKALHTY